MERSGLISQNPARIRQRPKDIGNVLYLRPYQPVKIKKCWRTPEEPFRVLTWFSGAFLGLGICVGFLLFQSLDTIKRDRQYIELSKMEKSRLQSDLERVQVINRESTRNILSVVNEVQSVLERTYDEEQRSFLLKIIPLALKHQAEDRIPASALIAMAAFESNYGRSDLAREHNNFFGIKAWKTTWQGPVARMPTVDSGRRTMANFRAYPGFEQGVEGYAEFLSNSHHYQKAFDHGDGTSFVRELLRGGYCPDDDYLHHIKTIMERHHLKRLDLHHLMPAVASDLHHEETVSNVN